MLATREILQMLYHDALFKNNSVSAYNAYFFVCLFVFLTSGGEETEYDIRNDPIRTEEREKDLVITRGIKCHVQNVFNIFKYILIPSHLACVN